MGLFNFSKKPTGKSLCELLKRNFDVESPNRKAVAKQVIEKGKNLNEQLARLACAFAYCYLGAEYRKAAISQFEKYLASPIKNDYFDLWSIYGTLADLYEAELDFKNAEQFFILQENEYKSNSQAKAFDPLPNVKLGRL